VEHGYTEPDAVLPTVAPAQIERRPSVVTSEMATRPVLDPAAYLPLVHVAPKREARALWITRWDYSSVTDVQNLVANAAAAGFNMLFFQVRGNADAFYTPGLEPWAARLSGQLGQHPGWDPLQVAVEAAHAHGLELHAYLNVYPVWLGQTAPAETQPQHLFWALSYRYNWADWRVADSTGQPMNLNDNYLWATPALSDVADRLIAVSVDIATRYAVDGVHLDLVRYPGPQYSYDPFSNAGYQAARAQDPTLTRADWQRDQITLLVGRAQSALRQVRPRLRLTAAVWPVYQDRWGWRYSQGYSDYYQDSHRWAQERLVEAIVPMIYPARFEDLDSVFTKAQFSTLVSDFMTHADAQRVYPGISAQYGSFTEIAERIAIARSMGTLGHAIFSARLIDERDYWDEFAAGPYAWPARVP